MPPRRYCISQTKSPEEDLFDLGRPCLKSSVASLVVPPDEGVDRFRDKEDEDTPLPILPSSISGITVTEDDIDTHRREGVAIYYDNEPAPYNSLQYDYVLPIPSSLTFLFHDVDPRSQSGNSPVGRVRLKITPKPRIHHMSRLGFFVKLYSMDYIKDVFIPDTNKLLNSEMNWSEYFRVIGCRLIMACYVGHSIRDLFLK